LFYPDGIKKIHLEPTTDCNARCPQCPRTMGSSLEKVPNLAINHVDPQHLEQVLASEVFAGVREISINGNFGDIVMHPDPQGLIEAIRRAKPDIRILLHTNGGALSTQFWHWLGSLPNIHVIWGIDGLADTHHLYRRNTRWETVIRNAQTYINAGENKSDWDMLIFKHNQHQVEDCKQMARDMGFTTFKAKPSTRWYRYPLDVIGRDYEVEYQLEAADVVLEEAQKNPPEDRKPRHYKKRFIFKEGSMRSDDYRESGASVDCRVKKTKDIYIAADMRVYPCCWMATPVTINQSGYYKPASFVDEFITDRGWPNTFNSLHHHSIEEILETRFLERVEEAWSDRPFVECTNSCGVKSIISIRERNTDISRWNKNK
jgi:MoaA/NifB/PqqE/SkfB family radical SAM enzyme